MKPKVLIVDDEMLNTLTFQAFLADDGYELLSAENGRKALELARAHSPDVILLDVMMPELDGYSVCREVRADPVIGRVPIIMVTALHDSNSRLEGLRAGADDFVTKPCSRDEMRARVKTIVSLNRFRLIAEERTRFARLVDLAPSGIVATNATGTVTAANTEAEQLLAVESGRTLDGDSIYARFADEDAQAVRRAIEQALAGKPTTQQEVRCHGPKGERILQLRATGVPDDGVFRALLIFSDVTAEARARRDLERMNERLDQLVQARTRQLEDANELLLSYASFVSHDLRSPLTVVKGYLSMVHEGAIPLEQAAPLIEGAYKATVMMQELVQNILQLAHDEHGGTSRVDAESIDPNPLIARVWMHVAAIYPKEHRKFTVASLPEITAHPVIVERVMYNLLTNAAKYSTSRERPVIEVGATETDQGPALFVRDNGVGFDSRDADKLFREFSRLGEAPVGGGFGLGLSLVARLVRSHGGDMWAVGKVDEGATFFVRFGRRSETPRVQAPMAMTA